METLRSKPRTEILNKKREDSGAKFKTEMCRNFPLGLCKFGKNCAFAHGSEDLRGKVKLTTYKTKDCKQFHEQGYCQFGDKCQFKHKEPETASSSPDRSSPNKEKRRLAVFKSLAPN